jgi:hypothetical protein
VARLRPSTRIDRVLAGLQRRGVRQGLYGSSRFWFWMAVFAYGSRRLRRAVGSESRLVYRGELRPGEILQIGHLTETYQGKRVRSRRRKIAG